MMRAWMVMVVAAKRNPVDNMFPELPTPRFLEEGD
jgi:hypothetical protein